MVITNNLKNIVDILINVIKIGGVYLRFDKVNNGRYAKKKNRNRRMRDSQHKMHVKGLAKNLHWYPPVSIPVDIEGNWNFDDPVGTVYYKRTYKTKHKRNRYTFYKKYSNRKVRRYNGEIHNGNAYRKVLNYDYM